jgi:formylmethanofuran dehydrogenase subunit B
MSKPSKYGKLETRCKLKGKNVQDTVCCGCSVVCDDAAVSVKKTTLQSLGLCRLGHEYCNSIFSTTRLTSPLQAISNGKHKTITLQNALEHSARLLRESKRPLFLGWSNSTMEAIQAGLNLAQRVNAVFDSTASFEYGSLLEAGLHGGEEGKMNLDKVRDFADHIVYWGVNPAESHHRHASRYTVFPKGKETPEGRESRVVSVVDVRETESMRLANHQLILSLNNGDVEFLQLLIEELEGTRKKLPTTVGGVPAIEFLSFAKQLREAETVALFYGNGLVHSTHSSQSLPLISKLSTLLNHKQQQCWTLPMVAYCNSIGAVKACRQATTYPFSVDFSSNPAKTVDSIQQSIMSSNFDCALIAGWDALSFLPGPIANALSKLPLITFSTHSTLTTQKSTIVLPTALTGAETPGTVYRMDGTAVPLKPFKKSQKGIYSEEELLNRLLTKLG